MGNAAGLVYKDGKFREGSLELREGRLEFKKLAGKPKKHNNVIVPAFVNCHTHLGDSFIKLPKKMGVKELVAPPNGYKHKMLREVSEGTQVTAMRSAIFEMERTGTSHFIDFREGGLEGVRRLLKASVGLRTRPLIFGRPAELKYDENEMNALLAAVDGIGLSSFSDWDPNELAAISEHARKKKKPLALHASEAVREDIDKILELRPAFLVHMLKGTDGDFEKCAGSKIPIVVCPRANSFFGLEPPVKKMLDAGVQVCLGTDNAMLASPDMFEEMRTIKALLPENYSEEIIKIALGNGRVLLEKLTGSKAEGYPEFLVMRLADEEPFAGLLEASAEKISKRYF